MLKTQTASERFILKNFRLAFSPDQTDYPWISPRDGERLDSHIMFLHLLKLHLLKNDKTNPVTKLPRKVCSLIVRQMIDMHQSMDSNTRQIILQVANVISYAEKTLRFRRIVRTSEKSWLRP